LGAHRRRRPQIRLSGAATVVLVAGLAITATVVRRRVTIQRGTPFRNLRFARYLGDRVRADRRLETDVDLQLNGRTATVVIIPSGGSSLTIVAGSAVRLGRRVIELAGLTATLPITS
jgi:hypothetical protein